MMSPFYPIQVHWLTPEEGGRKTPIVGGRYTPTARFAGEQDQFSVVLEFPQNAGACPTTGTIRLLFPDNVEVQQRIHPGVDLEIMEGSRVVARCVVERSEEGAAVNASRS